MIEGAGSGSTHLTNGMDVNPDPGGPKTSGSGLGSFFDLLFLLQAHSFASTLLLNLLVKDRDLIGHLHSMKKYFLMEQGYGCLEL